MKGNTAVALLLGLGPSLADGPAPAPDGAAGGPIAYPLTLATVFLNGRFVADSEAHVSVHDAGFQHGVGLFETMLAVRRGPDPLSPRVDLEDAVSGAASREFAVIHLHEHLTRLRTSAFALGLAERLHVGPLGEAVERACERAFSTLPECTRLRVRLTVSGGDLNLLSRAAAARKDAGSGEPQPAPPELYPTVLVVAQPAIAYPEAMLEEGVLATLAEMRVNPYDPSQGHKTLNYWARLRELQTAAAKRAGEALVFSISNHLAGGCVSSALLVRGQSLITPTARGEEEEVAMERERGYDQADPEMPPTPSQRATRETPSPVLPGITRAWALDVASDMGLTIERRDVTVEDVLGCDELMLTNSSWGVMPVTRVESRTIGSGTVGATTKRLMSAWRDLTEG